MNADGTSETIDEAIDRYTETVDGRIAQLTKQRDDLARSLKEVLDAIDTCGFAACSDTFALMKTLARARTAMLYADALRRMEDKLKVHQSETAA